MARVDLNSDLGESFGRYTLGLDEQVIPLVTSVNVACGMHAGDPVVMRRTVKLAAEAGIAVGAHPGYPDLQGFGRRNMALSPDEGYAYVLYQVGALAAFCRAEGVKLAHVKPHGQLYNRAAVDAPFAQAIAQAVADFNPDITLVALAGGELARAGKAAGLHVAQEFFADRNYTDEGTLVSRTQDNATITDEEFAVARVVRVIQEGSIESITGKTIDIAADTICVHGDNAHALEFARDIRRALTEAGIEMRVYERGCGETLACGTGACATCVAAALTERTGRENDLILRGGVLHILWTEDDHVMMTGPAAEAFEGTVIL